MFPEFKIVQTRATKVLELITENQCLPVKQPQMF